MMKHILKSLCCSHGWSYGVFWHFDKRNPMLLAFEDSYHDEQMRAVIDDMLLKIHIFGEGVIGKAALTGNHRWLFSDAIQDMFQSEQELNDQFVSGVKTILVVPVGSQGVVQFGSAKKILESSEILDQIVRTLQQTDPFNNVSINSPSSVDLQWQDLEGLFASLEPLGNCGIDSVHGFGFDEFQMREPGSLASPAQSSFTSEVCEPIANVDTQVTEQNFAQEQSHEASYIPGDDFGMDILNSYSLDDLYQLLAESPGQHVNNDALKECPVSPSTLLEDALQMNCSEDHQDRSVVIQSNENDLLEALGLNFGSKKHMDCREDPCLSTMSGVSQNRSERTSLDCPRKGLFSELGIDELISNVSKNPFSLVTNPTRFENPINPNKRMKFLECSSASSNFSAQRNLSCFSAKNVNPMPDLLPQSNPREKGEAFLKTNSGLWIDDSSSFNISGNLNAKKPEEPTKVIKKRARPGESSRPRPKDRQMIQDRLKELRGIIPNGAKCSIDALLDLTIKHMLFMQSIAKHADKLKEPYKPKLINQNRSCIKERVEDTNGATWAFEVGDESVVCPIIVEDLSPPGQMLIEMLCKERGQFLEIADVIKGFGLNILKGVMETQEGKIWAHFIVEAKRQVTRQDVFWSLVTLLQQHENTTNDSSSQTASIMNPGISHSEPSNSISFPLGFVESPR